MFDRMIHLADVPRRVIMLEGAFEMHFLGRVTRDRVAAGSKSERDAILLCLPEGRFILRRQGGNAFHDPVLEALVGQDVEGEGAVVGQTLIASRVAIHT